MKTINRKLFFENYPFRPLSESQVNNLNFLLDKLDNSELITRLSEMAYILATLKLETADTFAPVKEAYWIKPESKRIAVLGKMYRNRESIIPNVRTVKDKNGKIIEVIPLEPMYYGRGYVQLTHDWNYTKFNDEIQKKFPDYDILKNPELACEPEVAWIVLEEGMTNPNRTFKDDNFTGYTLENYFTDESIDFYHARKIINGMDRASLVQSYAEKYFDVLEFQETAETKNQTAEAKKAINLIPLNVAEAKAESENTSWRSEYNKIAENA